MVVIPKVDAFLFCSVYFQNFLIHSRTLTTMSQSSGFWGRINQTLQSNELDIKIATAIKKLHFVKICCIN